MRKILLLLGLFLFVLSYGGCSRVRPINGYWATGQEEFDSCSGVSMWEFPAVELVLFPNGRYSMKKYQMEQNYCYTSSYWGRYSVDESAGILVLRDGYLSMTFSYSVGDEGSTLHLVSISTIRDEGNRIIDYQEKPTGWDFTKCNPGDRFHIPHEK